MASSIYELTKHCPLTRDDLLRYFIICSTGRKCQDIIGILIIIMADCLAERTNDVSNIAYSRRIIITSPHGLKTNSLRKRSTSRAAIS